MCEEAQDSRDPEGTADMWDHLDPPDSRVLQDLTGLQVHVDQQVWPAFRVQQGSPAPKVPPAPREPPEQKDLKASWVKSEFLDSKEKLD